MWKWLNWLRCRLECWVGWVQITCIRWRCRCPHGKGHYWGVWPIEKLCKEQDIGILEKGCTVQKTGRPILTIYTCGMMLLRKELPFGVTMTVLKFSVALISTGSIARSASRRYLIYSEADFAVFRLAGTIRCTDGGEIWQRSPPPCQNPYPAGI